MLNRYCPLPFGRKQCKMASIRSLSRSNERNYLSLRTVLVLLYSGWMLLLPFSQRPGDLVLGRTGPFSFFPTYAISARERVAHQWVIGVSGKGKSKFLENCIFQDIAEGRGCGVIDPHSLLMHEVLRFL